MPPPLLTTKLFIPPTRPELVPRPRLIERLDGGLHRKLTHYHVDCKRGQVGMQAGGILSNFQGNAVHAQIRFSSKRWECQHSFYNAHHLREL